MGDIPWGTHFCQFYNTKEDVRDILVPYFKEGLENNEFCMWVTSEPLSVNEAKRSMKKAVKNFEDSFKRGQIEILDYSEWYKKSGSFDADKVLKGWVEKERQALDMGFDGLRLSGSTCWLEKKDWESFCDYEEAVNNVIEKYRMIALCNYSLIKCAIVELFDVIRNHHFSIIQRDGEWEQIENARLRREMMGLKKVVSDWQSTFNSTEDLIMQLDKKFKIIRANISTSKFLGLNTNDILGKTCYQLFHKSKVPPEACPLKKMKQTKKHEETELYIAERGIWIRASVDPILDDKGNFMGAAHIIKDITSSVEAEKEIKASLREKEVMLKEIHHRVKNNMQIIASLLNLQSRFIKDEDALNKFKASQERIKSMALIHDSLYRSKDLTAIDFSYYIKRLTTHLVTLYEEGLGDISLEQDVKDVYLDINRAIPCGLVVNELVSNSLKHAFPGRKKGKIVVRMYKDRSDKFILIIKDTGIGLPKGLDFRKTETLGLQLVRDLVDQLEGTIKLDRKGGSAFKIVF